METKMTIEQIIKELEYRLQVFEEMQKFTEKQYDKTRELADLKVSTAWNGAKTQLKWTIEKIKGE